MNNNLINKIATELYNAINEYQNIKISEQLKDISNQLDQLAQGSYQDFVRAVNKPTRQNVMKYEKSIAPQKNIIPKKSK